MCAIRQIVRSRTVSLMSILVAVLAAGLPAGAACAADGPVSVLPSFRHPLPVRSLPGSAAVVRRAGYRDGLVAGNVIQSIMPPPLSGRAGAGAPAAGTMELRRPSAPLEWAPLEWMGQKVVADDGAQGDFFGWSVAVDGNTALLGAYGVTIDGHELQGAVYVFTRMNGLWTRTARLTASDGAAFDSFGDHVAISGTMAAISADYANVDGHVGQGAVYVFTGSGADWTQQAKLTADDGAEQDSLGWSVAISGTAILAGAPFVSISRGAVYVFSTAGSFDQLQKLVPSDGVSGDFFGDAVAVSGGTALIGADNAAANGNAYLGAAYVFDDAGGNWIESARLSAEDGAALDSFGRSVAISGTTAFVGAPYAGIDGNAFQGAAYVFERSGDDWTRTAKLTASDGVADEDFGWSVALSDTVALVGANAYNTEFPGAVYRFARSGDTWTEAQKLVSNDGTGVDFFGWSVALSGATGLLGEPFGNVGPNYAQGAAYFYGPVDVVFRDGFDGPP